MHTEMKLSKFGNKVAKTSGISLLMDDLGSNENRASSVCLLGLDVSKKAFARVIFIGPGL